MNPDSHDASDKYQRAWQAQESQTRVTIDTDLLRKEVERAQRNFQAIIFWRDFREVVIALLMIPLWIYLGIATSSPWTWYLTVPVLAWSAGFMLVYRMRHKHEPSEPGEPLLHCVKSSSTEVENQIWLLRNVFWWYLLPPSLSITAFFAHVSWRTATATNDWLEAFISFMGLCAFLSAVYYFVYYINQRTVRVQLEPRHRELSKLFTSLSDETTSDDAHDLADLVSALADPARNGGWARNWNRIIPSWREAIAISLATLIGALCGLSFPIDDMGPVFFQTVVGAIIPFEIALGYVWLRSRKKQSQSPPADRELKAQASGVELENSANPKPPLLPRAPAILIIVLTVFLSIMAVLALLRFMGDFRFTNEPLHVPELDDVSAFDDDDTTHLDAWLREIADVTEYPSLSVAVVRDGEIVYQGAFGFEDIKAGRQAAPQTQYHVASVTKAFTATLAVILHDRGVVDLDQPVVKYLPEDVSISTTPELGATMTLRQLASHTSGLPRGVPGRVQSVEGWYQLEPQRLYDHLAIVPLESDPGTAEEYSNLGFGLLGHALERAAGKPFDRLMLELVCEPLKLERTVIQADGQLRPASGYRRGSRVETKHSFQERLAASGGLVTSTEDLAKFLAAQMKPGIFSSEMLGQLHTETKLSDGSASGTALGWSVRTRESVGRILKKNGGRSNCSAWIGFAPEHGVGVAVVTNCGGPDVDPIGYNLLERSIPLARKKLVTKDGYAKVAPYTGVRWENDRPIVRVQDRWSPLVSIDGVPIDRIMEFAQKEYGDLARKRFAEDLVRVLFEMDHEPQWKVTLSLKREDGQTEQLQILMTEHNRKLVRDDPHE